MISAIITATRDRMGEYTVRDGFGVIRGPFRFTLNDGGVEVCDLEYSYGAKVYIFKPNKITIDIKEINSHWSIVADSVMIKEVEQ